ncbi:hypothetical protein ACLOJK_015228, partial [Asimina triloba]
MPPRKLPRAIPSLGVAEAQPSLPQQGETRLPSLPSRRPPDDMTVGAPDVPLANPLEVITQHGPNTKSPATRIELGALTE